MTDITGRRLPDMRHGEIPPEDDLRPGDYWKVLNRETGEPLSASATYGATENLTDTVWQFCGPLDLGIGTLALHTVREEDDGTISVRQGDGSSNSVLTSSRGERRWHGYVEHGIWREG